MGGLYGGGRILGAYSIRPYGISRGRIVGAYCIRPIAHTPYCIRPIAPPISIINATVSIPKTNHHYIGMAGW